MNIISNTSPLIGFAKIEHLRILQQLFQRIMIPQTVYEEFFEACTPVEERHFQAVAQNFIQVVKVTQVHSFARRLDQGKKRCSHWLFTNRRISFSLMTGKRSTKPKT